MPRIGRLQVELSFLPRGSYPLREESYSSAKAKSTALDFHRHSLLVVIPDPRGSSVDVPFDRQAGQGVGSMATNSCRGSTLLLVSFSHLSRGNNGSACAKLVHNGSNARVRALPTNTLLEEASALL